MMMKNHYLAVLGSFVITLALSGCGSEKTLEQAAATGDIWQVKNLVRKGVDVDIVDFNTSQGKTALIAASEAGHDDVVLYLINQGADVEKTSFGGVTPLRKAAFNGHVDIVKHLLESGANPESGAGFHGRSPFVWAILGARANGETGDYAKIIDLLKQSGSKCRETYIHPVHEVPVELEQLALQAGKELADAFYFACKIES